CLLMCHRRPFTAPAMAGTVGSAGVAGHGQSGPCLCISGLMTSSAPIAVAFREVRHFQPDDCLHCEAIELRGALHDWTIPAHRREGLHQFQWLRSGTARIDLDGGSTQVVAPAAFLLPPGC